MVNVHIERAIDLERLAIPEQFVIANPNEAELLANVIVKFQGKPVSFPHKVNRDERSHMK